MSKTMTGATRQSTGGSKYKSKGASTIDENLFGSTKGTKPDVAVIIKPKAKKGPAVQETVTLSRMDLNRITDSAIIRSRDDLEREKKQLEASHAEKQAAARARKEKMMRMEEERKRNVPPSDIELENEQARGQTLNDAERMLSEELDDVKRMNQMMLYAKTVTIRDSQVEEKKLIEKERKEEERRLDTMMEIERLKALKMYEEREVKRLEDRQIGAAVIVQQMKERERERIRQLELQDQEREAMLRQIEAMKLEEQRQAQAKREAGHKLLEEVALANAEQIRLKKKQQEAEKEEERRIAAYLREKEMREQEYQMEQERIAAEKERETARLRAQQERAQDKQAELDALRAKRAVEETERVWRRKEKGAAERQSAINAQLSQAREQQKLEKERRLAEQAQQEKEEFDRILRVQHEQEMLEQAERQAKQNAAYRHKEEIQSQIVMNAEMRKKNRMEFLEEGNKLRSQMSSDKSKLETIKTRKLVELDESGVPDKYLVDLQRRKFS